MFGEQLHDVQSVELLPLAQVLENPMFAEYRTMFSIVVEFLEYRAVFLKVLDGLPGGGVTLVECCAVEQPFVCLDIPFVCCDFIRSEDF